MPTSIEWCDETINPLGWGCYGPGGTPERPQPCSYCYARRIAARNLRPCSLCRQFIPHWHTEQLDKPYRWKKPRRIFVQSMGDLMHPCTPADQIEKVRLMAKELPRHTIILLTKNTERYAEFNPWPDNCWLGGTSTTQMGADRLIPRLLAADARVRFVSHEPLLGPIKANKFLHHDICPKSRGDNPCECGPRINWAIIGAMTGPGAVKPDPEWVHGLVDQYQAAGVPVFLKDNLRGLLGWTTESKIPWPQEFPA